MDELQKFIEEVHNEPFNILSNNCLHKHARIVRKARELGHDASLMGCISIIPLRPVAGVPLIGPHIYAKVDDKVVDVSMEPELEQTMWKNKDVFRLFSVNVSKLKPHDPKKGPPLPRAFPGWPWEKR